MPVRLNIVVEYLADENLNNIKYSKHKTFFFKEI